MKCVNLFPDTWRGGEIMCKRVVALLVNSPPGQQEVTVRWQFWHILGKVA